jgi:hypothetical protein
MGQHQQPKAGERYAVNGNIGNVVEVVSVSDVAVTWTRSNNNVGGRTFETQIADWRQGRSKSGHQPADLRLLRAEGQA